MTIVFSDSNPVEFRCRAAGLYYVSATGGAVTVERQAQDDSWVAVDGSPVADGSEKMLRTVSKNDVIRATGSSGVEFVFKSA